jgi:hypothetical protein
METVLEFAIGVTLFVVAFRGYTGQWPWEPKP